MWDRYTFSSTLGTVRQKLWYAQGLFLPHGPVFTAESARARNLWMRFCVKNSYQEVTTERERARILKMWTEHLSSVERISDVLHGVLESEPKPTSRSKRTWLFQDTGFLSDQTEQVGNQKDTIVKKISQTRKHSWDPEIKTGTFQMTCFIFHWQTP